MLSDEYHIPKLLQCYINKMLNLKKKTRGLYQTVGQESWYKPNREFSVSLQPYCSIVYDRSDIIQQLVCLLFDLYCIRRHIHLKLSFSTPSQLTWITCLLTSAIISDPAPPILPTSCPYCVPTFASQLASHLPPDMVLITNYPKSLHI